MPIIRKIKEPILVRLVGCLLIPVGIILFSSNNTAGLIALIIGLGLLIANAVCTGIEINTDQKTYRKLYSFFGFVFGDWESSKNRISLRIQGPQKAAKSAITRYNLNYRKLYHLFFLRRQEAYCNPQRH